MFANIFKWEVGTYKIDNNYDEDFREHFCNHYVLVQYELLLIFFTVAYDCL